jgi:hypothetical protein
VRSVSFPSFSLTRIKAYFGARRDIAAFVGPPWSLKLRSNPASGAAHSNNPHPIMRIAFRNPSTKRWLSLLAILGTGLAVGLWTNFRGAHAAEHEHSSHEAHAAAHDHGSHGGHETAALSLNEGKRWETDQPLRTGMERIRAAASPVIAVHAAGQVSAAQTKAMADTITDAVIDVVANCKLSPAADATLHVIITDLLSGAGLLAENPASGDGIELIAKALRLYPEYFDHPGWNPELAAKL